MVAADQTPDTFPFFDTQLKHLQHNWCTGCRLEQFARIVIGGLDNTYIFDEELKLLTELSNIRQWPQVMPQRL